MSSSSIDSLLNAGFFGLPGTAVNGVPITVGNKQLHLGLVEIGCKPRRKYGQLRDKENLVRELWLSEYHGGYDIDLRPSLFRTLVHFDSSRKKFLLNSGDCLIDACLVYDSIPDDLLESMPTKHRKRLLRSSPKEQWGARDELREIIYTSNGRRLYDLIRRKEDSFLDHVRGRAAEVVVQWDIERCLPERMKLYRNQTTDVSTQRYEEGTEFDSLLVFYNGELYTQLIENLRERNHLHVKASWDTSKVA
jgi:hypothetical protein